MRVIRQPLFGLACLALASIAGRGFATDLPADPILRIEAGMHTSVVKAISLSADQKLVATGTDDKTVRLWSVPDGRLLRTFRMPVGPGNDGKVFAVALSPDGAVVAAGGWDAAYSIERHMYVTLFDARTGAMLSRLGPLPTIINILEFSPDGGRLVAGLGGRSGVKAWAAPDWKEVLSGDDYGDQVYGANFASDGRLTTASYDGDIRLYDADLQLKARSLRPAGAGRTRSPSPLTDDRSPSVMTIRRVSTCSTPTPCIRYFPPIPAASPAAPS